MSIRILKHDLPAPSLVLMLLEAVFAIGALFFVGLQWGDAVPGWRTTPVLRRARRTVIRSDGPL